MTQSDRDLLIKFANQVAGIEPCYENPQIDNIIKHFKELGCEEATLFEQTFQEIRKTNGLDYANPLVKLAKTPPYNGDAGVLDALNALCDKLDSIATEYVEHKQPDALQNQ